MPIGATWDGTMAFIEVEFDRELVDVAELDVENWWARLANKVMVVTGVASTGSLVAILGSHGSPETGPDVVSYRPPPFDVCTPEGGCAPGFENFPVTIVAGT